MDARARASITCFRDRWTNSAHTCVACHAPCARFKSGGWGGRRMAVCCIRSTILSSYLPLPSSSFPSSSRRSFAARPLPPFSTAAPNNSKRYRTKIGVQNYATRGSGISSSADLAPAVSLVLMTRHPSRPSDFAQQSIPSPINKGSWKMLESWRTNRDYPYIRVRLSCGGGVERIFFSRLRIRCYRSIFFDECLLVKKNIILLMKV